MYGRKYPFFCLFFAFLMFMPGALQAQLDPRLWGVGNERPDFLDLYQQSAQFNKPKPEVLTIFDFSLSMDALMYHPLYQNLDNSDDTALYLQFSLNANNRPNVGASTTGTAMSVWDSGNNNINATFVALIKPDGAEVTQTDAERCAGLYQNGSTTTRIVQPAASGLYNTNSTSNSRDIRHWILAASHARFSKDVDGVVRTIDIPLPWTIIRPDSPGNANTGKNPLDPLTKHDKQVKITTEKDNAGHIIEKTTTHGSLKDIEYDISYRVSTTASATIPSDTNTYTVFNMSNSNRTVQLHTASYIRKYVRWLFEGRYQSSPSAAYYNPQYNGRFIVYNALARANNASPDPLAGGQISAEWGRGFGKNWGGGTITTYKCDDLTGVYSTTPEQNDASKYAIPAVTRLQATKQAAISTWIDRQADVYWAFRYLDHNGEAGNSTSNANISNNSKANFQSNNLDYHLTNRFAGRDSGWIVLNNTQSQDPKSDACNSVRGMRRIAAGFTVIYTPLTHAMARSLVQYNDPSSVFNDVVGLDASQCSSSFIILFTDGQDQVSQSNAAATTATPYVSGSGTEQIFSALAGNRAILANRNTINRGQAYWNFFTFAAMGAHMSDSSLGTNGVHYLASDVIENSYKSGAPSTFLPFSIQKRGDTIFSPPRRVTTMTVGVSLGGRYTDTASPKRAMFLGAVLGDPNVIDGNLRDFRSFTPPAFDQNGNVVRENDWLPDPLYPDDYPERGRKAPGAVYYFDATDAGKLSDSLKTALLSIISSETSNATSNPNLPFIGASYGQQVFMGSFVVPEYGGAIWTGDLCMFGTREVKTDKGDSVVMTDGLGNRVTALNAENAIWAASKALRAKRWRDRKLYTRLPGAPDDNTALIPFMDDIGLSPFNANGVASRFTDLAKIIGVSDLYKFENIDHTYYYKFNDEDKKKIIQFASGGDRDNPETNRNSTIMGDIINSTPVAIEFLWSDVSHKLSGRLAAVGGDRFRLILVGSNQGWLHAFGEVTKRSRVTEMDSDGRQREREIVTAGDVEELWSFMPTDFLENLPFIYELGNLHRFMVDGAPVIYHLDIPRSSGIGNGVVDPGERALAIFGLGMGGRSYYALNIQNPFEPRIQWTLIPDEMDKGKFPNKIVKVNANSDAKEPEVREIIARFGFSTATPAFGRIIYNNGATNQLKDAVFLSGGFSLPEVDARFAPLGSGIVALGRSVMALDVWTGEVLDAFDLTKINPSAGPVGAGVIPFEFIVNSGMAQRAYFTDYNGGLWVWGDKIINDAQSSYYKFREATSRMKEWLKPRKIYQDNSGQPNARYTTPPAPFRVGDFPGEFQRNQIIVRPAAVGIAMVSGDRNNSLDKYDSDASQRPSVHRLTVVFDRQDSELWTNVGVINDSFLRNFSGNIVSSGSDSVFELITPGSPRYYLAPKIDGKPDRDKTQFGYYINFPSRSGDFVPKGINTPSVVSGSLFYSIFTPTAYDRCTGGFGKSETWMIADVINPLKEDRRNTGADAFCSGLIYDWGGVASNFIQVGTRGVIQGGAPSGATGAGALDIRTFSADPSYGVPKPRVWRVIR